MFQLVRGCSFVLRCCRFPCFMKEEKSLNQVLGLQNLVKPLANQNKKKRKETKEKMKNLTIVFMYTSFSWLLIGSNRIEVHDSNNHS